MAYITTVTPYFNRPEMLKLWKRSVSNSDPGIWEHRLYVLGEESRQQVEKHAPWPEHVVISFHPHNPEEGPFTIGHWHNRGAREADSTWFMKLDADVFAFPSFWLAMEEELGRMEAKNNPALWCNVGFFYLTRMATDMARRSALNDRTEDYFRCNLNSVRWTHKPHLPAASQFICRRETYLELGGCHPDFKGYGWEDYQQLYMLERNFQGKPLYKPGELQLDTITGTLREDLSRSRARALYKKDPRLSLFHQRHPRAPASSAYRSFTAHNRKVLLDYVTRLEVA